VCLFYYVALICRLLVSFYSNLSLTLLLSEFFNKESTTTTTAVTTNYLAPDRGGKCCDRRACTLSVLRSYCLSVCIYKKQTRPNFTKFSVHVNCGRGSILLWRQCTRLCTSGFVDNVVFSPMWQNRRRRYVSSSSPDGGTGGKLTVYSCLLFGIFLEYSRGIDKIHFIENRVF